MQVARPVMAPLGEAAGKINQSNRRELMHGQSMDPDFQKAHESRNDHFCGPQVTAGKLAHTMVW